MLNYLKAMKEKTLVKTMRNISCNGVYSYTGDRAGVGQLERPSLPGMIRIAKIHIKMTKGGENMVL